MLLRTVQLYPQSSPLILVVHWWTKWQGHLSYQIDILMEERAWAYIITQNVLMDQWDGSLKSRTFPKSVKPSLIPGIYMVEGEILYQKFAP